MGMDQSVLYSSLNGSYETVQKLLELGADTNIASTYDTSVLMKAVLLGNEELIALLVQYGANLEAMNSSGHTALVVAAVYGPLRCTAKLIDLGANLHTRDPDGSCIIALVIRSRGSPEVVELLIQRGADHTDNRGFTPLMFDAFLGATKHIEVLLRYWPLHNGSLEKAMGVADKSGHDQGALYWITVHYIIRDTVGVFSHSKFVFSYYFKIARSIWRRI